MKNNNLKLKVRYVRINPPPRGVRPAGVALALLLGLLAGGLTMGAGRALADPDYGQVPDYLYGQRHILRDDDLLIRFAGYTSNVDFGDGNYSAFGGTYTFTSSNSILTPPSAGAYPIISNGTGGCGATQGCPAYWRPYFYKPKVDNDTPGAEVHLPPEHIAIGQAAGRFFNTNKDTLVQFPFQYLLSNDTYPRLVAFTGDDQGNGTLSQISVQLVDWVTGGSTFIAGVGDFNGDGYDDLLMGASDPLPASFVIATAQDVNHPELGFILGPVFSPNPYGIRDVAVGDFNGDGVSDFASAYIAPNYHLYVQTYYVTPTKPQQPITINAGSNVDLSADPKLGLAADYGYHPITMTTGRFTAAAHDQLIVGSQLVDNNNLYIQAIDFSGGTMLPASVTPRLIYTSPGSNPGPDVTFKLKAGRFNPASTTDQLVFMSSAYIGGTTLKVISVDPAFNPANPNFFTPVSAFGPGDIPVDIPTNNDPRFWHFWGQDIVIGNFDHQQPSPTDPNTTERNPTLQIALVGINASLWPNFVTGNPTDMLGGAGDGHLFVYNVDPLNNFNLSKAYDTHLGAGIFTVPNFTQQRNYVTGLGVIAGDFQGRSYRLGAPTKITLEKAQPSVILAAPPMHADFVTSATGNTGLFNLSVIPEGFYSKYELDTTSSTTSTNTNTTDSSFGVKMTVGASVGIGEEDAGDGITIKDTATTTADLKTAAETKNGSFSTTEFSLSQQTGLTDQLWIKDSLFYVYSYPVLGRTACPAGQPNCADSAKLSLIVQFTVPAPSEIKTPPASNLEWYQPPWEYGNIFSYPAGYSQLQAYVPDIQKLSEDVAFYTDASNIQIKNSWNSGSNTSQTVKFDQNYSLENDLSVSTTVGLEGIGTISLDGSLDLTASLAFGQAHESTTTLAATTGIIAQKPGSFAEPVLYAYAVKPVIFGRQPPGGSTGTGPTADINTFGLLQTAYIADPTDTAAGLWWLPTYGEAPDIALNHPNRWIVSTPGLANPIPDNCRPTGTGASQMDCVDLAPSNPANPWLSEVHYMRGFFISSNNFGTQVTPGQGPQLVSAKAGDQLVFATRVYNYSLAAMPPSSNVYVRFYATLWNAKAGKPYSQLFPIGGDKKLDPISPFDATPGAPLNWVTVTSDSFDTTDYGDKYLAFFVVVWAENADGSLMPEAYGHGLQGLPGTKGTINYFSDLVALEELVSGNPRSYSNNIGFYNAPFYIEPPTVPPAEPNPNLTGLKMGQVLTSRKAVKASKPIVVSALIKTNKQPASKLMVDFYDGDPKLGGKLFDIERIPYIKPRGSYRARVIYRSRVCGHHNIHVKVADGKPYAVSGKSQKVRVQCPRPKR